METTNRPLHVIAREIETDWNSRASGVSIHAKPYLEAMRELSLLTDMYYTENGKGIVLYFLSNSATWRGDKAREIKAELRAMLKGA